MLTGGKQNTAVQIALLSNLIAPGTSHQRRSRVLYPSLYLSFNWHDLYLSFNWDGVTPSHSRS
jgi:hypothetical protein